MLTGINGEPVAGARVLVRLRNTAPVTGARIYLNRTHQAPTIIILNEAQFGIAAGQAAAIYDCDNANILLGGGWISKAPTAADNQPPRC